MTRNTEQLAVLLLAAALVGPLAPSGAGQVPGGWDVPADFYDRAKPIPDVDKNPDIMFEPPFLHLVSETYGNAALADPQQYVRASVVEWEGGKHAALITPAGIHITRLASEPVKDPPADAYGKRDREWNAPLIPFLKALSSDQLRLLVEGRIVDVTSCRKEIAELLFRPGAPTNITEDPEDVAPTPPVLASAPYVVASLRPVPQLALFRDRPHTAPYAILQASSAAQPTTTLSDVQPPGDGGPVFWCRRVAYWGLHRPPAPAQAPWGFSAGEFQSAPTGADEFIAMIRAGLPRDLQQLSLDQLNRCRADAVLRDLSSASGVAFDVDPAFAQFQIYAAGPKMPAEDVLEALFIAGWIKPGPEPMGGQHRRVGFQPDRGQRKTARLLELAEASPDPDTRKPIQEYLAPATQAERFTTLPLPASCFTSWWTGRLADLSPEEAQWVRDQLPRWAEQLARAPENKPLVAGLFGADPSRLVLRASMLYCFEFGACVPYREFDQDTRKFVPRPVPESFYTELGASHDRPVYSVRSARYAFE